MANLKKITITGLTADPDGIAQSQTPSGAGAVTLNGAYVSVGVATLPQAARVSITSTSNIANRTFTIVGTDRYGYSQSVTLTGPNNTTVYTDQDFVTVTSITISGAAAGAITIGTNGVTSSAWYPADYKHGTVVLMTAQVSSGATLNYSVEVTPTNLNDYTLPTPAEQITQAQNAVVFPCPDVDLVSETTSKEGEMSNAFPGIRITLNSWTSGSVILTIITANNNTF